MALSRKFRRYIVSGLIILFFVVAVLLILYAQGYRYNSEEKGLEQIGMIMVTYDPTNAISTLDGESAPFDITALGYDRFTDLPIGEYYAKVETDGYHPWEKTLEVNPDVVTWGRYVTLFRTNPDPKNLAEMQKLEAFDFSPDREWLCVIGEKDSQQTVEIISLKDSDENQSFLLKDLSSKILTDSEISEVKFAPDSTNILVTMKDNKQHFIFSRETESTEPVTILENVLPNISEVKWHPTAASTLYALQNEDLYRLPLTSPTSTKRLASKVVSFTPSNTGMYFVRLENYENKDSPEISLKKMGLDGSNPEAISDSIDSAKEYTIANSANGRTALLAGNGNLYFFWEEEGEFQTEKVANDVRSIEWSVDNDKEDSTDEFLLYSNEHEIYTFNPLPRSSETITRYAGEKIGNAMWYSGNYKYIIFSLENKIKIIELDSRDRRNVVDFWQAPDDESILPDSFYIDNDAEHIFLETKTSNKNIIRDLNIRGK